MNKHLNNWINTLEDLLCEIILSHWNRLGYTGHGKRSICSTDPEALLILTLIIGHKNKRLYQALNQWIILYGSLLSNDRISKYINICLKKDITSQILPKYIPKIKEQGRSALMSLIKKNYRNEQAKKIQDHNLIINDNLLLSLRYLFGVNSKADTLYYALVLKQQKRNPFSLLITPAQISRLLHYDHSSIYRTLKDFENSQLLVDESSRLNFRGKDKVYFFSPNSRLQLLAKPPLDKCYIDWFHIIHVASQILHLKENLKDIHQEDLIKKRVMRCIDLCNKSIFRSCIQINQKYDLSLSGLNELSIDDLMNFAISMIQETYTFITNPKWPPLP